MEFSFGSDCACHENIIARIVRHNTLNGCRLNDHCYPPRRFDKFINIGVIHIVKRLYLWIFEGTSVFVQDLRRGRKRDNSSSG